ncbi:TauD/TfdA family dioxygenase [Archangium violaceum]|uniref:TauD/TfdA family dioxygenase n=1 Tax=Archangium violaceum TaxID=83451 RepID=UPI002B2BBF4C|nr:TauD/TfdA family dioxygenase [Archangium violaceum]
MLNIIVVDDSWEKWRARSAAMHPERFSARTFDAHEVLDAGKLASIRETLEQFGAVHVRRTGLRGVNDTLRAMCELGFAPHEQFTAGGRTSESWQKKWVEPGLRRMDFYPPELYLLPNNEVQYQRCSPRRVLFYCHRAPSKGGRTFVHRANALVPLLRETSRAGRALIDKLERFGLVIETGFLHRAHPLKSANYFQSWQERFDTDSPDEVLVRARAKTLEYDECWFRDDPSERAHPTLMTRITISAFWSDPSDGRRYLRFPRIAMDPPSAKNGYRRFTLSNGEELSVDEREALITAYLASREGIHWNPGDLVLFDNLRYGHSRESFEGDREVYVAMGGELWDDRTEQARRQREEAQSKPIPSLARFANTASDPSQRYAIAPAFVRRDELFSVRTFNAEGALDARAFEAIRREFARHGVLHIRNTGLSLSEPGQLDVSLLESLGFGQNSSFAWGGMNSGRTTRKALSRELRATDEYPAHLWLLPHNEVLYQRHMPASLLFFSASACPIAQGGRTFVHEADGMERWIRSRGPKGEALLRALREHGMLIEMGFVDERHPEKHKNFFRSWQDRFETHSRDEAEARCRASTLQFDECWWREEPTPSREPCFTLMTRVRVPGFYVDPASGRETMFFPRIALDPPSIVNGHRRYPLGNGRELDDDEVDLLLGAFLATREGLHYEAGDILLCDNIRYGHSREAFTPPRTLGVAMANTVLNQHLR